METNSLSENYQIEKRLCRETLEYLGQGENKTIAVWDPLSSKNLFGQKLEEEGLFESWNGPGGMYGGIQTLSEMRHIIMSVLKEEKLVVNTSGKNGKLNYYVYKITKNGKDFVDDEENIEKELDRFWKQFAEFYKNFFTPEITKDQFKEFIILWSKEVLNSDENERIRNNTKRAIAELYFNPFLRLCIPKISIKEILAQLLTPIFKVHLGQVSEISLKVTRDTTNTAYGG